MAHYRSISEVSRITGVPKDLLRMWERRYAFPRPQRDRNGDRINPDEQMDKLLLIRRLVDQGRRPGKLMAMSVTDLRSLLRQTEPALEAGHLVSPTPSSPPRRTILTYGGPTPS